MATDFLPTAAPGPAGPSASLAAPEPVFMPFPGEPASAYLARLKVMRHHLEQLIAAVERGMVARPLHVVEPGGTPTAEEPPVARDLRAVPAPPLLPVPRRAVELAPPVAGPAAEDEERQEERRAGDRDRRLGHPDRRRGHPDLRVMKVERRGGPRDRRSGRRDRRGRRERRQVERRTVVVPNLVADAVASPKLGPVMVFWGVNIVCWLLVVAVALFYGVGS